MKPAVELVEFAGRAIDPRVLPFAILSGLILAAVAVSVLSFFAALRARALVRGVEEHIQAGQERSDAVLESLRENLNSLAAELQEIREQSPITLAPASPRPGHWLRVH